ncbi:uncharacterized protein LAESUDRAFT_660259 [Laetiporus sulphureus 93-53]|uniref:Uncharacterized protein n=1 Tax=Laetiporus sulphureus 93-53 TaxID=1314785 RepID=A0A165CNX6_9APHY|nr:uncharacterized protein LAESUDRAFT_660259 [Laetiporus sulphureus 93-53]KZT03151.1 hypothetical protein LAESUDRAFT_660259 [Laetiporus sulphureus 93-53]
MPWPSKITRAFATVEEEAGVIVYENQYYGPYNKLLCTLFPPDSDFIVSPNYLPGNVDGAAGVIISFEITLRQHPVLVLEVKPPQHLSLDSTREAADRQVRRRLVDLSGRALLPVLYGISAMGTKLCFYEFETAPRRMTPRRIPSDPELTTDVAPKEQWDCDVLEADGEQRLRALARQITEACERLQA